MNITRNKLIVHNKHHKYPISNYYITHSISHNIKQTICNNILKIKKQVLYRNPLHTITERVSSDKNANTKIKDIRSKYVHRKYM